jgi:iron complex transport system substrate-binding protein
VISVTKRLFSIFIIAVLAMVTAACGSANQSESGQAEATKDSEKLTIKHESGETPVPKNPQKVVVFDYGVLDSLDKLGVNITGVPKESLPSYLSKFKADKYENVGTLFEPDFEKIHKMKPDLIIISGRSSEAYDELSKIAPTINMQVDSANYMQSFEDNVKTLGKIFNKEDLAKKELAKVDEAVKNLHDKAASMNKKTLVTLVSGGKVSAYGPGSRFGLIHDVFGLKPVDRSIKASTHGQSISFEYIVEKNPDYLFVVDRGAVVGDEKSAKQVIENALVKKTKAYQNHHITYLNPDYWYLSSGGLTSVSKMVKEVTEGIEDKN